jgi:hypothetical protein
MIEVVKKIHTNTTTIRPTGELAFEVIDHNDLSMLDILPIQLQSGGLRVCTVAIIGGEAPTMV